MGYGGLVMGDGVRGVGSGCVGDGWWEMLRGMCEKSSTHYKTNFCLSLVVKHPCFISKMYL